MRAWKAIALACFLLAVTVAGRELLADYTLYGGNFYGGFDGGSGGSASCDGSMCVTSVSGTPPLSCTTGSNPACSINLDATIGPGALAANTVGAGQIINGSVGTADIADGGIGQNNIAAGAVGTNQIAGSAVTTAEIANGTIVAADIVDGGIGQGNIAAGAVGPMQLADGSVGSISGTTPISVSCVLPGVCTVSYTAQDSGIRTLSEGTFSIGGGATQTLATFDLATDGGLLTEVPKCKIVGTDNTSGVEFCCPCASITGSDGVSCDFSQTPDGGRYHFDCKNWAASSTRIGVYKLQAEAL